MKKRKVWVSVVAAVLVIASVAAIVMIPKMKKNPVTVISVSEVSFPDYGPGGSDSFGQVTTDQVQTVFLSDTQVVKDILVEKGQKITAGDPLFTYDTTLSDLAVERKEISIRQTEMELKRARAELGRINGLRPMANSSGPVVPPTEPAKKTEDYSISPEQAKLGTNYAGEGTAMDKPCYFWLRENQEVTDELVRRLLGDKDEVYVIFQIVEGDAELTPFTYQYGVKYTSVPVDEQPTEPETQPTAPDPTEQPTEPETQPTEPKPTEKPTEPETKPTDPKPTEKPTEPETKPTEPKPTEKPTEPETKPTEPSTELTVPETTAPPPAPRSVGSSRAATDSFRYKMAFFDYTKANVPAEEEFSDFPEIDMGSGYTKEEIAEMRFQQQKQIRELEFNLRMGDAELKIMQKEASNGEVTADFDGIVVSVMTPEESKSSGQPMLKVAGGGGYYVEGSVSEMELSNVKPGQSVFINNWDTGMTYEGTIAEIGQYPVENQDAFYGSENETYYPYRVFIDESADLMEGSYVNLSYQPDFDAQPNMCLDNAFLRTEGKKSYVYVRREDGKLEKRFVQIGPSRDGYSTPILSGLSDMDFIAFPYGKDVRDGAATVEGTMEDLYNG